MYFGGLGQKKSTKLGVFFAAIWYNDGLQNHAFWGIDMVEILKSTLSLPVYKFFWRHPPAQHAAYSRIMNSGGTGAGHGAFSSVRGSSLTYLRRNKKWKNKPFSTNFLIVALDAHLQENFWCCLWSGIFGVFPFCFTVLESWNLRIWFLRHWVPGQSIMSTTSFPGFLPISMWHMK